MLETVVAPGNTHPAVVELESFVLAPKRHSPLPLAMLHQASFLLVQLDSFGRMDVRLEVLAAMA